MCIRAPTWLNCNWGIRIHTISKKFNQVWDTPKLTVQGKRVEKESLGVMQKTSDCQTEISAYLI